MVTIVVDVSHVNPQAIRLGGTVRTLHLLRMVTIVVDVSHVNLQAIGLGGDAVRTLHLLRIVTVVVDVSPRQPTSNKAGGMQ